MYLHLNDVTDRAELSLCSKCGNLGNLHLQKYENAFNNEKSAVVLLNNFHFTRDIRVYLITYT